MTLVFEDVEVGNILIADGSSPCLPEGMEVIVRRSIFFHVEGQPWKMRSPVKCVSCLGGDHELLDENGKLFGFRRGFKQ